MGKIFVSMGELLQVLLYFYGIQVRKKALFRVLVFWAGSTLLYTMQPLTEQIGLVEPFTSLR